MTSGLTRERWERISALLDALLDLPAAQRSAWLDRACPDDPSLRAEVRTLLGAHDQAGTFLEQGAGARAEAVVQEVLRGGAEPSPPGEPDPLLGGIVGHWRLVSRLGEGGMGVVYQAERTGGELKQRAALKLIKRGMDTHQVLARFEAERQALALMDHPAIARILDAGQAPDGRPFFAMEYVEGLPITRYCDRERLTTPDRLALFVQLCEGVQHAHHKAVIHRDLKPSNVLVRTQDGRPALTIIDFGIAKALAEPLTDRTLVTELGMMVGTPEYMSPEQASTTGRDVDTRSDVYSLGVMLYELLVGALPFDPGVLRRASLDELSRTIREVEPPRPSARVATLGERASGAASSRRTDPRGLRRELRGDLDWITMRALEKDRGRRYGSPADLAEEIRRYLRSEPVLAHAPSAVYRARKFVRRHRLGVAAAAVMTAGLAAGGVGSAVGLVRARRAEARAVEEAQAKGQVADFLKNLFRVSNPGEARGNSITARELLDKAAAGIDTQLPGQPAVRAELQSIMGYVYANLGLYAPAEILATKSLETRSRILGEEHRDTLASMQQLVELFNHQGRYADAERRATATLAIQRRVLPPDDPALILTMDNLAMAYVRQRRLTEAEATFKEALAIAQRQYGPDHLTTLQVSADLALAYQMAGRRAEAEPVLLEALASSKRLLGDENPATLSVMMNLANCYEGQGRLDEAERLLKEVVATETRVLGPEHQSTLVSQMNLANTYISQHRYAEAERLLQEVVAIQKRVLGPRHSATFISMYNLGCVYGAHGDRERAMQWIGEAVDSGYFNAAGMAKDVDLVSLHGPEFDALVARARRNAEAMRSAAAGKETTR